MDLIHGEPSFRLTGPEVDLHVSARAGHLAPVVFHLSDRDVSPYALAPWAPAEFPELPPLLAVLRGDFLCLPFGSQQDGPPHGEVANLPWSLVSMGDREIRMMMEARDTGARVEKILNTRPGQHAVFTEHRISGLEGDFSYGNHPVLDLSGIPDSAGRISVSPFHWGSVYTGTFSSAVDGARQALAEGARFADLREVPLAAGGTADLTRYPSRPGNDDLVMMINELATDAQPFAWSAAVLDGYVWFSLKNPADFPATILWLSNGGRTAPPWNGRHIGRIGIEEVCSHFADGVEISRTEPLASEGIATTRHFSRDERVSLKTIQAAAIVELGFGMVANIIPAGDCAVTLISESGAETTIPIDWKFLS